MNYGLMEKYYLEARTMGIDFLRYEPSTPPLLEESKKGSSLMLSVRDNLLGQDIILAADALILSTGIVPHQTGLEAFDELCLDRTSALTKAADRMFGPWSGRCCASTDDPIQHRITGESQCIQSKRTKMLGL